MTQRTCKNRWQLYLKWWYLSMPGNGLKNWFRWDCQYPAGTNVVPSESPASWAMLTAALPFTTDANSSSDNTAWRRNACLTRPKHQSGANFVCPAVKKLIVTICVNRRPLSMQSTAEQSCSCSVQNHCHSGGGHRFHLIRNFVKSNPNRTPRHLPPYWWDVPHQSESSPVEESQHTPYKPHFLGTKN